MKVMSRIFAASLLFVSIFTPAAHAAGWSHVAINGQRLTVTQLQQLEAAVGSRIAPGAYLVDAQGCWANHYTTTGWSNC